MRIYVGNLSFTLSSDQLRQTFSEYGEIESAEVIFDHQTGRSRGFAFVRMASDSDAADAIASLNGTMLDGRRIKVSEALPQRNRSSLTTNGAQSQTGSPGGWYGGKSW
jgi:RNA recognition motif-containing protein